jgi:hypothetical protein
MNKVRNFFTPASSKGIESKLYPSTQPSNRRNKEPSPIITVDATTKEEKVANPQSEKKEDAEKNLAATPIKITNLKIKEELNAIVPIAIKKNDVFKNALAYLSRSDAHHDLGEIFKDTMYKTNENVKKAFDSGLPVPATFAFHEGNAFASVVISATNYKGNTINIHTGNNKQEEYLQEALNQVPDCTKSDNGAFSTFAIGVEGNPIFKYRVVRFVTKCDNNASFKGEDLSKIACISDFGKTFVTNTKLGEDFLEAAFIVDFSQHHFMKDLASGVSHDFKIHYLMTPEVVNDPADKPNVNNKSLFGILDNGIKLISYVQTDPEPISYTKYNQHEPSTSNNFFSNYDFTLSPIKQIFTKQKAEKLIATLNISYDGGSTSNKPLTDTIEDSKDENSITTVVGFLKKILTQIQSMSGGTLIEKFNFNSKIQQKRGGDWFQALSCLTAKNRTYTRILPTRGTPSPLNSTCPVYLVTHDRIAVAFALLNGVNVIYLDYYGRIFIFKNGGDPTLKSSGKTMEEILFDGIKDSWKINDLNVRTFPDLISTAEIYMDKRNEYVTSEQDKFTELIKNLIIEVNSINSSDDRNFQKGVMKIVRELFTTAVKLAFIDINLIDIQRDLSFIKRRDIQLLFSREYDPGQSAAIAQFSKALNNVNSIQDRFGDMKPEAKTVIESNTSDPYKFKAIIPAWVDNNVTKLDVYRFANKLLENLKENNGFNIDRLLCIYSTNNTEMRQTDSHIFLPFIQILNDANKPQIISTQIISVINPLIDKTTEYYKSVVVASRSSRGESPQLKYYNGVANLLYESMIFLKPKPVTSSPSNSTNEDALFSKDKQGAEKSSTDNRLLNVDHKELEQLRDLGKYSGNTENAPTIPVSSSGGGRFADITIKERIASVICDVSVKQVTWTLLTANLIDSTEPDKISKFLEDITNDLVLEKLSIENTELVKKIKALNIPEDYIDIVKEINSVAASLHLKMGGGLPTIKKKKKKGGAPPANLMLNFDLGVHPLTPIYSMLTSYYNIIGEKSQTDPFFYTYFTYINVLEKMKKIIEEKYLIDVNNKVTVAAAYMIGFGLYTMLFASHTSLIQNNEIMSVIQMSQQEYHDFSLKNDCFASTFSGAIIQTPEDEAIGLALISNKLFSNFINNEVNIKQILQEGTSVDNLPDYTVLKERMFKLMGEIVVKVNADRGTPIGVTALPTASTALPTASTALPTASTALPTASTALPTASTALPTASTASASGIAGISQEDAAARAARGQQKYEENVAKGIIKPQGIQDTSKLFTYSQGEPGNVVTSTTGQRTRGGKRRSKRYLINKRKTIKKRPNKKTNTKKRYRRPRRTKKY